MENYAGFGRRMAAQLVDGLILTAAGGLVGLLVPDSGAVQALVAVGGVLYYVLFIGVRGQTPGKMALGVRVVGPDGGVPGVRRAFLREVLGKFASSAIFFIGYLSMLWDARRQCVHDKIAGTVVLRAQA